MEADTRKMDTGGTKLAIAIVILWVALLFFFIALHPNGIANVTNPVQALKWLISEFQGASGETSAEATITGPQNVGAAPTQTGA